MVRGLLGRIRKQYLVVVLTIAMLLLSVSPVFATATNVVIPLSSDVTYGNGDLWIVPTTSTPKFLTVSTNTFTYSASISNIGSTTTSGGTPWQLYSNFYLVSGSTYATDLIFQGPDNVNHVIQTVPSTGQFPNGFLNVDTSKGYLVVDVYGSHFEYPSYPAPSISGKLQFINTTGNFSLYDQNPLTITADNDVLKFTVPSTQSKQTKYVAGHEVSIYMLMRVDGTAQASDITYNFTGFANKSVKQEQISLRTDTHGMTWAEGFFTYDGDLPGPADAPLTFTATYLDKTLTANMTFQYVTGVVDANGDGHDDRTGEENAPPSANIDTSPAGLAGMVQQALSWITGAGSWFSALGALINAIFSMLPAPISGGLVALFSTLILLTVIKLIRG